MANIMDYVIWRGDLSWELSEFNEVDNVILSELVYVDFTGIVPGPGQGEISLREASVLFFEQHTEEEIKAKVSSTKMAAFLMQEMADTKRFGSIRLANYVKDIRTDEQSQFSAMTVELGDGRMCVVYSGTDDTIVGWKENFNMSFLSETPGQLKAVSYLETVAAQNHLPLRIMGHSKGGNLSVYAATHASRALMERIAVIYSNDGPGFPEEMLQLESYRRMLPKIHAIIPQYSIVGLLMRHESVFEVVASGGSGVEQHDMMNWEVQGPSLVHLNKVDDTSLLVEKTLKSWMQRLNKEQREEFVNAVFGILEDAGIRTVDELAKMNNAKFRELMHLKSSMDKESQEMIKLAIRYFCEEGGNAIKEVLFRK